MNTLKMYGTASATANGVCQVIIPSRGKIRGVQVNLTVDSATDNAACTIELSRASAREIAVNGAQQCIVETGLYNNFVTSGLATNGITQFLPVDIEVVQGQIIYMHATVAGTLTFYATLILHYS